MAKRRMRVELQGARSYPVVLLVSSVDRRILPALRFVSRLPFAEPLALHFSVDPEATRMVVRDWLDLDLTWLPLHIRDAEAGDIATSVAALVAEEAADAESVTVVVPELNIARWWHPLLHRQTARRIAADLQAAPRVTTVIVPFTLSSADQPERPAPLRGSA